MREDLEKKLLTDFPILYNQYSSPPQVTAMCWGFECDDGWFDLIYELSQKLTDEINNTEDEDKSIYSATQVKEKYGSLSFYMMVGTDKMFDIIDEYSDKSFTICEICGKGGIISRRGGWYKTLCVEHQQECGYETAL